MIDPSADNQPSAMPSTSLLRMPEGNTALAQAAIYLATAPKSNAVYTAYGAAASDAHTQAADPVPLHLRNAPTKLMKQLEYGKGYEYAHDDPEGTAAMVDDPVTGVLIGLPTRQVPNKSQGRSGTRWASAQGQVQVETFKIREPGTTLAAVYEQQRKEPPTRRLEVNLLRPDFFIVSGIQNLKRFYVRAEIKDREVRGMSIRRRRCGSCAAASSIAAPRSTRA